MLFLVEVRPMIYVLEASPMFPVLHNGGLLNKSTKRLCGNMYPLVARGRLLSIVFK